MSILQSKIRLLCLFYKSVEKVNAHTRSAGKQMLPGAVEWRMK